MCTCAFGQKNKTDQLFSLKKIFLFSDGNINQLCLLSRYQMQKCDKSKDLSSKRSAENNF